MKGGLNLIVVSAVNNEPQCRLLRLIYPQRNPTRSCEDMDNVRRQIEAFVEFDASTTGTRSPCTRGTRARSSTRASSRSSFR